MQVKTNNSGFLHEIAALTARTISGSDGKMRWGDPLAASNRSHTPWFGMGVIEESIHCFKNVATYDNFNSAKCSSATICEIRQFQKPRKKAMLRQLLVLYRQVQLTTTCGPEVGGSHGQDQT